MSLADKVAALRAFFGVKPEVQLLPAVGRGLLGAAGARCH